MIAVATILGVGDNERDQTVARDALINLFLILKLTIRGYTETIKSHFAIIKNG